MLPRQKPLSWLAAAREILLLLLFFLWLGAWAAGVVHLTLRSWLKNELTLRCTCHTQQPSPTRRPASPNPLEADRQYTREIMLRKHTQP